MGNLRDELVARGVPFVEDKPPVFSGELIAIHLFSRFGECLVSVGHRLRAAGLSLREALAVISELAEFGDAWCRIAEGALTDRLHADMRELEIVMEPRRAAAEGGER